MVLEGGVRVTNETDENRLLEPLTHTGRNFQPFMAALVVIIAWGALAWWTQMSYGFQVTGLNNSVVWGIYIANFVFLIGISHAGILISATVRLLDLKNFKPVARMAEVLTIVGLASAILSVIVDLGRPDRWFNILVSLRITSPLAWDFVFIALYFTLSAIYLLLSLKEDVVRCREFAPRGTGWIYGLLIWFYDRVTPKDHEAYERLLKRFALLILPFPVFGSGMVVPFIFSVLVAKPTWNVPFFGPYFLTAAILSGVSAVVILATILRNIFQWDDFLKPIIYRGLASLMLVLIPIYVYFTFLEQFTSQYVQATHELVISDYLLMGPYAAIFWSMILLGFIVPFTLLIVSKRSVTGVFTASVLVTFGLWVKRVIIVVPTLIHPNLPFDIGNYAPTWVEWSIIAGIFALGTLLYSLFVKVFPIIELDILE